MVVTRSQLLAIVAVLAPPAIAFATRTAHPLVALGAWSVALVGAAFGVGTVMDRVFAAGANHAALRVAFGFAGILWSGGTLSALHWGTRAGLGLVVGGGLLAAACELAVVAPSLAGKLRGVRRTARAHPFASAVALSALACVVLRAALSLHARGWAFLFDDAEAYLVFVRQLIETGSFDQPLSLRRVQSFGGMTVLLGVLFSDGGTQLAHAYVMDWGVGLVATAALVMGEIPGSKRGAPGLRVAALLVLVAAVQPRTNASPQYMGVLFGVALASALARADASRDLTARIPLALLAAALASLRQSLLPWAALLVVVHHAVAAIRTRRWAARGRLLAIDGTLTVVFLLPWMVQALRQFGTPLYPLIRGDVTGVGTAFMVTHVDWARHAANFVAVLRHALPLGLPATIVLAGAAWLSRRARSEMGPIALAWLGALALQVHTLPLTDMGSQTRYAFAPALGAALALLVAARRVRAPTRLAVIASALVAVAMQARGLESIREDLRVALGSTEVPAQDAHPRDLRYGCAQAAIPRNVPVVVMVEESFRLDFSRNRIFVLDFPGTFGRFPAARDPSVVREHLRATGAHWLLFEHPRAAEAMFSRSAWEASAYNPADEATRTVAPLWLTTFDAFEDLAWACERTYEDGVLVVVDLERCPQLRPRT